jgi:uncharacterized lipoprotein YajG
VLSDDLVEICQVSSTEWTMKRLLLLHFAIVFTACTAPQLTT